MQLISCPIMRICPWWSRNPIHIIGGRWSQVSILHGWCTIMKHLLVQVVSQIALEATDMGRPLYEKYGFVKMEDEMEIK